MTISNNVEIIPAIIQFLADMRRFIRTPVSVCLLARMASTSPAMPKGLSKQLRTIPKMISIISFGAFPVLIPPELFAFAATFAEPAEDCREGLYDLITSIPAGLELATPALLE